MKNKYQQAADHIQVTPEMEQRILENISKSTSSTVSNVSSSKAPVHLIPNKIKKIISISACAAAAVLLLLLTPWTGKNIETTPEPTPPAQLVSPLKEFPDLKTLANELSFSFSLPAVLPDGYELKSCYLLNQSIIQLIYENDGSSLTYRTAVTESEDISGDFRIYTSELKEKRPWGSLLLKGSDSTWSLLLWSRDGYSYSVSTEHPLTKEEAVQLADSISEYQMP